MARAIARLRQDAGVELPVRTLFEAPTVARLAERVEAARQSGPAGSGPAAAALVPLQEGGARRPFFLVPGGRGDAQNLFKLAQLARRIGQDQPCYGFFAEQLGSEDAQDWVEATAAAFLAELRSQQPDGPYVVGGTCVGGVVAFEMAQQLRAQGECVAGLLLVDTRCPDGEDATVVERLRLRRAARAADRRAAQRRGRRGAGRTGDDTDALSLALDDVPERGLRLYRYRPNPYPGRITLFVNQEWHDDDPGLGWERVAAGGLDVRVGPGSHMSFLVKHLDVAADLIRGCLDELQDPGPDDRR